MTVKYVKIVKSVVSKTIWYDQCCKNYIGYTFKVSYEDDIFFYIDSNENTFREKWWTDYAENPELFLYREDVIEIKRLDKLERILNK